MDATAPALRRWVTFAGVVLIVVVLYSAQTVVVPIALALLLTFVLAPAVTSLERWIGNLAAVMVVVTVVFSVIGLAGWGLSRQLEYLANDLPGYKVNILEKVVDIQGMGRGGSVEKIQTTIDEIQTNLDPTAPARGTVEAPVVVTSDRVAGFPGFAWLTPLFGPLGTAALVLTLLIFMLLERRDLRDRFIRLIGYGHLALTTKALDEAGSRVSRQLLMQLFVNTIYGVAAGVGLYFLGVPYALVWAVLGGMLRFIPYVGPVLGAGMPILVSLAALHGWTGPASVVVLFVVLELFTNLVLETKLYAGAAGVSQVALLVSVAFWTWLWGPLGLLMATPLTVCLVVIGKHVPGLDFVGTLMSDAVNPAPDASYYQRLLAHDVAEASELIEQHVRSAPAETVYDALLLPALNYAERDRIDDRLSQDEEAALIETTRELLPEAKNWSGNSEVAHAIDAARSESPDAPLRILGYAVNGVADELALEMLVRVVLDLPVIVDITNARLRASQLVSLVRAQQATVVCFADLPPSPISKTRYLVKRLRAAFPDLQIIVGRWAPATLADTSTQALRDAGANFVVSTLAETRTYLSRLTAAATVTAA